MIQKIFVPLSVLVFCLASCSNESSANEANFKKALAAGYAREENQCLSLLKWPVDVPHSSGATGLTNGDEKKMAALESIGLVKHTIEETEATGSFRGGTLAAPAKRMVKRYTMTADAKPFFKKQNKPNPYSKTARSGNNGDLCYATITVDKVTRWEGPVKLGDYQEVKVFHTFKYENIAKWFEKPEIKATFPQEYAQLAKQNEVYRTLVMTNKGWEMQ